MTDAEKMLQVMMAMGAEAKEQTQTQLDTSAQLLRMAYDSYVKVGFSSKMAFELTKTMLESAIQAGTKK